MEKNTPDKSRLTAESFVNCLLEEGTKSPCDETATAFNENSDLPPYYDEVLYKRGQKFFNDNIFALLFGKFLGLLTVLAVPTILKVLIYTKMSGSPMTAYRRYLATLFHMCIWYRSDFSPSSKSWQSLIEVRNKHNAASKRCQSAGFERISQKDMALTQFGFMGYALARREKIGLHNVDNKDLRAFVHVWRVIGFIMGIEDRFNICRDSLEETVEICKVLATTVFKPLFEKKDKDFLNMAAYLSDGMWAMNPTLNAKLYLNLAYRLLQISENNNPAKKGLLIDLNFLQRIFYQILIYTIWSLQFAIFKLYHNYTQHMTLWLMKVFPFLAYYKYGYANSHVRVLENNIKNQ